MWACFFVAESTLEVNTPYFLEDTLEMTEKQNPQGSAAAPESHAPLGALADEVDESLHPLLQAVVDNVKFIVGGIVLLIAMVGGIAVYDSVQESQLVEGRDKLAAIVNGDEADRVVALEAFAKDAPSAMKSAVELELASALSAAGEHAKAADVWQRLSADKTAGMGTLAELGRAAELARAEKHAEAASILSTLVPSVSEGYKVLVLHRLAYETELAGDTTAALKAWQELEQSQKTGDKTFIKDKIIRLKAKLHS